MLSLKEAAQSVGMGKPGILKAIQKGRISAKKNELGEWEIDPAELYRVYRPVAQFVVPKEQSEQQEPQDIPQEMAKTSNEDTALREKVQILQEMVDYLKTKLDEEGEERRAQASELRRTQAQLTALLTDQRATPPEALPRRRWFAWG